MHLNGTIITRSYLSPCGPLLLGAAGSRLCLCDWEAGGRAVRTLARLARRHRATSACGNLPVIDEAARQLDQYFAGRRHTFDLPLLMSGTEFQQTVWHRLTTIPYGVTTTYAAIAAGIGRPESVRAVAGAIGANPLSVLVPCHRVVGSDGTLTGYAGGLDAKRYLLSLENVGQMPAGT